ncbi:MAG: hypothetical protein LRZ84_23160 [Desertifilum sp.]|nr:hypothetical protein [Desertifilum sp.]
MNFDREPPRPPEPSDFAVPLRQPLVMLRDTEGLLRRKAVDVLVPVLPDSVALRLQDASDLAEESLEELAEIDLETISDRDLKPARVLVGLSFAGFGGLAIALLMLYISSLHPEMSAGAGIHAYWYPYAFLVSLGVTGMMMVGREILRSHLSSSPK